MLPWATKVIREIVVKRSWPLMYSPASSHELALRIRAQFGYEYLMMYKRARRKAVAARAGK